MEYVLALVAMIFGYVLGRIYGHYQGASFERALYRAVLAGKTLRIIIDKNGIKSEMVNGKVVHSSFELYDEITVEDE